MRIGERIKELRSQKGESLQKVAKAVGVSKAHLSALELGKSDNPRLTLLLNLADHFDTSVSYLIGEKTKDDPDLISLRRNFKKLSELDRQIIRDVLSVLKQRLY
jgi:transcriptional regulator with XRE-family HTH domain